MTATHTPINSNFPLYAYVTHLEILERAGKFRIEATMRTEDPSDNMAFEHLRLYSVSNGGGSTEKNFELNLALPKRYQHVLADFMKEPFALEQLEVEFYHVNAASESYRVGVQRYFMALRTIRTFYKAKMVNLSQIGREEEEEEQEQEDLAAA